MAGSGVGSSTNEELRGNALVKALEAASFVSDHKSRISELWRLLTLKENELIWLTNSDTKSSEYNEQLLLLKTPKEATGHAGISHGGFIASIIDECLCYAAYPVLPNHIGVTASLSIDYLKPIMAESWVVVRSIAQSENGSRKATVEAEVYSVDLLSEVFPWKVDEKPCTKARQIVVEPKWHQKIARKN